MKDKTEEMSELVETRRSVLMEALKAVENERLDTHSERLREANDVILYREETGEDAAYSLAICHAEKAILKLLPSLPPSGAASEATEEK